MPASRPSFPTRRAVLSGAATLAAAPSARAQLRPISIAISSTSLVAAAPRIAQAMGLIEARGVQARLVIMPSASAATQALIGGSVEFALAGPGEILAAQTRGQKLVALGTAYRGLGASLVLSKRVADRLGVKPDAPVADRLKAIDGVLIGTANATSSYTLSFKGAANARGSSPRLTYLDAGAMAAALESGAIEGFIASAPFWAQPIVRGAAVLWIAGPRSELPPEYMPASSLTIAALRSFVDANAAVVQSLLAALADFAQAIEKRPAAVKAATATLFPDLDRGALDLLFDLEAPAWRMKRVEPADIAREIAFLKTTGAAFPGLDAVDPAALTLPAG